jgi:glycolate oxidase FAD binding subunit
MTPQSEKEIADIVRDAAARATTLEIAGHGTKRGLGRAAPCDETLDVGIPAGIVTYEPEELVLIARAGTPVTQINSVLAGHNQMLGFSAADWGPLYGAPHRRATLGGIVATDACGSRRVFAGGVRDSLLGCRFVNGEGEIIRAGSRVMKNVTGFDVPKLMCGAFGTLGVLTEVTFKLAPKPPRVAMFVLKGLSAADGLAALRRAAQLPLECTGLAYLPKAALHASAGAHDCGLGDARSAAFIRVEGTADPLIEKLAHLTREFQGRDTAIVEGEPAQMLFAEIGDAAIFAGRDSGLWRLCVPPRDAADAIDAAGAHLWTADWAGGALWLELPATLEIATRLRAITGRFGGHATLVRGSAEARSRLTVFEREPPALAILTRNVKLAFDPKGVLNPGRMYEDV